MFGQKDFLSMLIKSSHLSTMIYFSKRKKHSARKSSHHYSKAMIPNAQEIPTYICVWLCVILHTCNTDQQETWFSETPSVSSLYQSAHEPSDTSLELKKKQHSIQGMNTLRKWIFDRKQKFVNRVSSVDSTVYISFLSEIGYWHLESIWEVFLVTPWATEVKQKDSGIPGCLMCSGPLNLSQDVPATARSQAMEQHCTQQLAPKEAHTHQALLPGNSHSQRKGNFSFSILKYCPLFWLHEVQHPFRKLHFLLFTMCLRSLDSSLSSVCVTVLQRNDLVPAAATATSRLPAEWQPRCAGSSSHRPKGSNHNLPAALPRSPAKNRQRSAWQPLLHLHVQKPGLFTKAKSESCGGFYQKSTRSHVSVTIKLQLIIHNFCFKKEKRRENDMQKIKNFMKQNVGVLHVAATIKELCEAH